MCQVILCYKKDEETLKKSNKKEDYWVEIVDCVVYKSHFLWNKLAHKNTRKQKCNWRVVIWKKSILKSENKLLTGWKIWVSHDELLEKILES